MSNTFYDHGEGIFTKFDAVTGKYTDSAIKYLDSPALTSYIPKQPNLEFQKMFTDLAYEAIEKVNKDAKFGFVLDQFRLDGFPGAGFTDGSFTAFVVRKDKIGRKSMDGGPDLKSDAGYRYEMRAFDSKDMIEHSGRKFVLDTFVRQMKELDAKV